jgi:hypothetical protein
MLSGTVLGEGMETKGGVAQAWIIQLSFIAFAVNTHLSILRKLKMEW